MNWRFKQSTGELWLVAEDGATQLAGTGWAGQREGKNNPAMQSVHGVGPLCCGWYTIGEPHDSPHTGKFTMNLTPDASNEMFGRGDFRMHGASAEHPELSSEGCIVQQRPVRERVWGSGFRRLEVVA